MADFDTSAFSTSNKLHARILQYRARVELGEAGAVLSDIDKNDGEPDLAAVKLFAQYSTMPDGAITGRASALAKAHGDNATVQLLCGTVLANAGMKDEATALLAKHQGSLDAYVTGVSARARCTDITPMHSIALLAQIHLSQNRVDLATQEVRKARSWASDSLLVNLAESWVGLREVRHTIWQLLRLVPVLISTRVVKNINPPSTSTRNSQLHPRQAQRAPYWVKPSLNCISAACPRQKLLSTRHCHQQRTQMWSLMRSC